MNDIEFLEYREYMYIEGGPEWIHDCLGSGRADMIFLEPMDSVVLYPGGDEGSCEYVRTNRLWKSPIHGTIHTVFQFSRKVKWNTRGACSGRCKCGGN